MSVRDNNGSARERVVDGTPSTSATSQIYVIGQPGSSVVKIGTTIRLDQRLRDLQNMSPIPVTLLWSAPGDRQTEAALHRHFADRRRHGEWFDFDTDDAVELVKAAAAGIAVPTPVPVTALPQARTNLPDCTGCGHWAADHVDGPCSWEGEFWRACRCAGYRAPQAAKVSSAMQAGGDGRYASAVSRGTGQRRVYTQRVGGIGGGRFWWSCSWSWRDGRLESCTRGEAPSAEHAQQLAAEHATQVHGSLGGDV